MARYLLDTDIVIDISKGNTTAIQTVRSWLTGRDEVGVSAIQVAEFFAGLAPSQRLHWTVELGAYEQWILTSASARQAGVYRFDFARRGIQLSLADAATAAVANERGAMLVTNNAKHFPMVDIRIISLRP